MEWGSPEVGIPRVNLRRVSLENAANPRYITAAGSHDQIVVSMHHRFPECDKGGISIDACMLVFHPAPVNFSEGLIYTARTFSGLVTTSGIKLSIVRLQAR